MLGETARTKNASQRTVGAEHDAKNKGAKRGLGARLSRHTVAAHADIWKYNNILYRIKQ